MNYNFLRVRCESWY